LLTNEQACPTVSGSNGNVRQKTSLEDTAAVET
jgi:hypothetical protein